MSYIIQQPVGATAEQDRTAKRTLWVLGVLVVGGFILAQKMSKPGLVSNRGKKRQRKNAYGRRYSGDPYWLTIKYPATCHRCGKQMRKGERAFRYKSGAMYCDSDACGQAESRSFEAAAFDESQYGGGGGYGYNPRKRRH